MLFGLMCTVIGVLLVSAPIWAENSGRKPQNLRRAAIQPICMTPVGVVKKHGQRAWLEIEPEYAPALAGLQGFSHLWAIYWFHEKLTPRSSAGPSRSTPAGDPANPLTGVFACRSPERPNLIGFTACRIIKVNGNVVGGGRPGRPGRHPHPWT